MNSVKLFTAIFMLESLHEAYSHHKRENRCDFSLFSCISFQGSSLTACMAFMHSGLPQIVFGVC